MSEQQADPAIVKPVDERPEIGYRGRVVRCGSQGAWSGAVKPKPEHVPFCWRHRIHCVWFGHWACPKCARLGIPAQERTTP